MYLQKWIKWATVAAPYAPTATSTDYFAFAHYNHIPTVTWVTSFLLYGTLFAIVFNGVLNDAETKVSFNEAFGGNLHNLVTDAYVWTSGGRTDKRTHSHPLSAFHQENKKCSIIVTSRLFRKLRQTDRPTTGRRTGRVKGKLQSYFVLCLRTWEKDCKKKILSY